MAARVLAGLLLVALLGAPPATFGQAPLQLEVDAREAPRHLLRARLRIPVTPGPLTLVYPKWLPGTHGPSGPVTDLVDIRMRAGGQPVPWQRDGVDLYAFRVAVPAGSSELEVELRLVAGLPDGGLGSPASLNTELAMLKWSQLLLYPEGAPPDALQVEASVLLPGGWQFATALSPGTGGPAAAGVPVRFAPVSLTTLVDSPLMAGRHFRTLALDAGARPVTLALAADGAAALAVTPDTEARLRRLVAEADALFGARHYRRYVFLVTLSDLVAQYGLESHESSENRVPEASLTNPAVGMLRLPVLAHEYVHSWNGKYRRPAGLATPDFQAPMRGDLLWVYEGLTQYLGYLLAARSGLVTPERYRDRLAQNAAYYTLQPGRQWRPLADTAVAAQLLGRASPLWRSTRRSVDYYNEGALVWLEADMLIRDRSRGRRSLDDFCRAFFGGRSTDPAGGPPPVVPYGEDDLYAALEAVQPFDWRQFFAARIRQAGAPAPVGGLTGGGWQLAYGTARNAYLQDIETLEPGNSIDLAYSLGLRLSGEGLIDDVLSGTPAGDAGLTPGMQLVAVNGRRWTAARLRDAIEATAAGNGAAEPLQLLVQNGDRYATVSLAYAGGLREPRLERLDGTADRLGASIAPRGRRGGGR